MSSVGFVESISVRKQMSQNDAMKYARKQVTDHGHATLEGVRGIRTDVPIRSSVRSPFPPFRIKSKQLVKRLNAELWGGHYLGDAMPITIENLLTLPAGGKKGRLVFVGGVVYYDNGSSLQQLGGADSAAYYLLTQADAALPHATVVSAYPFADADLAALAYGKLTGVPSTFTPVSHGAAYHTGSIIPAADQNFGEQQALAFRVENLATLPAAGNKGRLVLQTSDNKVYYDNGSTWVAM
jgi:hypothetical protein